MILSRFEDNYFLVKSSDIEGTYWLGRSTLKLLRLCTVTQINSQMTVLCTVSKWESLKEGFQDTRPTILLAITSLSSVLQCTGMISASKYLVLYNKEIGN